MATDFSAHLEFASREKPDLHRHAHEPAVVNSLFDGMLLALHATHTVSLCWVQTAFVDSPIPQSLQL